jgi:hypothetical protein
MDDYPGWIQLLYKRKSASHALHTSFLLHLTNSDIAQLANFQPDGRDQLRKIAILELNSEDTQIIALSLVFLGVVGQPDDLVYVEPFVNHPFDLVRKAARTCQFELRQGSKD